MKYALHGIGALLLTTLVGASAFPSAAAETSGSRVTVLNNKQLDRVSAGLGLIDTLGVGLPVVDPTITVLGGIGGSGLPTCSGCSNSSSTSSSSDNNGTSQFPFGLGLGVTGTTLGNVNVPSVIVTPFGVAILPY